MSEWFNKLSEILRGEVPDDKLREILSEFINACSQGSVSIGSDGRNAVITTGDENIVGNNNNQVTFVFNCGNDLEGKLEALNILLHEIKNSWNEQNRIRRINADVAIDRIDSIVLVHSLDNQITGTGFIVHKDINYIYVVTCDRLIRDINAVENNSNSDIYVDNYMAITISSTNKYNLGVLRIERRSAPNLDTKVKLNLADCGMEGGTYSIFSYRRITGTEEENEINGTGQVLRSLRINSSGTNIKQWQLQSDNTLFDDDQNGSPIIIDNYVMAVLSRRGNSQTTMTGDTNEAIAIDITHLRDVWKEMPPNLMIKDPIFIANHENVRRTFSHITENPTPEQHILLIEAQKGFGRSVLIQKMYHLAQQRDVLITKITSEEISNDAPYELMNKIMCELESKVQVSGITQSEKSREYFNNFRNQLEIYERTKIEIESLSHGKNTNSNAHERYGHLENKMLKSFLKYLKEIYVEHNRIIIFIDGFDSENVRTWIETKMIRAIAERNLVNIIIVVVGDITLVVNNPITGWKKVLNRITLERITADSWINFFDRYQYFSADSNKNKRIVEQYNLFKIAKILPSYVQSIVNKYDGNPKDITIAIQHIEYVPSP